MFSCREAQTANPNIGRWLRPSSPVKAAQLTTLASMLSMFGCTRQFSSRTGSPLHRPAASLRSAASNQGAQMRFEGTAAYVADKDLMVAVNAAIALERPLLVKGEPGTGKTELARQVAAALGLDLIEWHVKSTTKAQQGLYEYDAVSRLRDSQLGDDRFNDIRNYIKRGKLWDAFAAGKQGRAADRRDRQGRHRVSQRPAAGTRSHGVLRLRDRRDDPAPRCGRSSSSPPTTRRNCRTLSCAAASSTTSAFPTSRRCTGSSTCTIPASSRIWCARR